MKVLKRNQIIILVMSLMLITAGYLNFTANYNNTNGGTIADRSDEKIGDAQLVSTIPSDDEKNMLEALENNNSINKSENENENKNEDESIKNENSTLASNEKSNEKSKNKSQDDYYFTTSKLERNTMYSESLETYQDMYNNQNASTEQKKEALKKINKINNTKNSIMIAENLIIAKGFEDVVIFVNDESTSVILKTKELKEEQVAQVQNIVSRELKVDANKIHISKK